MTRFTILGTDTDAGKTTFSLLWLTAFADGWHYWKPLETGDSDSETVRSLVPGAIVHPPIGRFRDPVAPPLAARREGRAIPPAAEIARHLPDASGLLIETFGGPFSPLNESELQIDFIQALRLPTVLVSSSRLGAIGRTLAMLDALRGRDTAPRVVVLIGAIDPYAQEQIATHGGVAIYSLRPPGVWDAAGVRTAAVEQRETLQRIADHLEMKPSVAHASGFERSLVDRDRAVVWHPYTSLKHPDPPLPVVGASGEFLHLADGRRVIDAISSWWTILHGHRQPRLMSALAEAMTRFDHVLFAGVTHPPAVRVAELLLETMPWTGGRAFFSDNGSTAVEVALKMAYQHWRHRGEPRRTLFIGFENSYHGDTFGAMAVGRDPLFFGPFEPLLFRAERVPVDADRLDELLEKRRGETAAIIIEPLVQGAGGMRMHSPDDLRDIAAVARRHDVLLIVDEVMTGCFRTGSMWAFQQAGIAPDLVAASKTLAGGILPLAATLASPRIVAAFDTDDRARTFFHGHSFTAHPLACSIAACNLQGLKEEPPAAPARFAAFWRAELLPLMDRPNVQDVRIRGTIAAIELRETGGYLASNAPLIHQRCLERGVFLRPLGNVLYAMPPLETSVDSLARIAMAMKEAITAS
jgi:adenosylmethionine-8-amino-7-oxononanoate transaminase/dethiobiotin synthase